MKEDIHAVQAEARKSTITFIISMIVGFVVGLGGLSLFTWLNMSDQKKVEVGESIGDLVIALPIVLIFIVVFAVIYVKSFYRDKLRAALTQVITQHIQENVKCERVEDVLKLQEEPLSATVQIVGNDGVTATHEYYYQEGFDVMVPRTTAVQAKSDSRLAWYYDDNTKDS